MNKGKESQKKRYRFRPAAYLLKSIQVPPLRFAEASAISCHFATQQQVRFRRIVRRGTVSQWQRCQNVVMTFAGEELMFPSSIDRSRIICTSPVYLQSWYRSRGCRLSKAILISPDFELLSVVVSIDRAPHGGRRILTLSLTIESHEPVHRLIPSLLTPRQLTRFSWPTSEPTFSPRVTSHTCNVD